MRLKLLFDHLPKTGGTALLAFLEQRFGEGKISPLVPNESISFGAHLLSEFAVVGGHMDLSPSYNWANGIYHITVLRDPIERFLSHYSFALEQPHARDPFEALARLHDVPTLIRLPDRHLTLTIKDYYIRHFVRAFAPPPPSTPAALFAALEQRYHLIGLTERLDDVARILCVVLGLDPSKVPPVRVTRNRVQQSDLDPDTLAILHELTAADRALYQLAAARFTTLARTLGIETTRYPPQGHQMTEPPPNLDISSCFQPPPTALRILAAELHCPASEANDCALTGADCVLAIQVDPGDAPLDPDIELRITNAFHQVVYRENRMLDLQGADQPHPVELHWRFCCPLGAGLYRCSLAFGLVRLTDVYEFTVVQPPRSPWSGLVDLRPAVAIIEDADPTPDGLAGRITPAEATAAGDPGSLLSLPVTIQNEGTQAWQADGITRVVATYKIFDAAGICVVEDGLRTLLPHRMAPGDTAETGLRVKVPVEPGHYTIAPQFVRERVTWFGEATPLVLQAGAEAACDPTPEETPAHVEALPNISKRPKRRRAECNEMIDAAGQD